MPEKQEKTRVLNAMLGKMEARFWETVAGGFQVIGETGRPQEFLDTPIIFQ